MKKLAFFAALIVCASSSQAVMFHSVNSIVSTTQGTDLAPASNLIQGAGVGFDANEPHDQITTGFFDQWVTDAPGGFPADYIAVAGSPILEIDLGLDVQLSEISVWGYNSLNANGVAEFSLRFATEAETMGGFGTSIGFNPTYFPTNDAILRQSFAFGQTVTARYVEFTVNDNFFIAPGDGTGGETPGGDRVGLGRIAFAKASANAIPEPATLALIGLGLAGVSFSRRKTH